MVTLSQKDDISKYAYQFLRSKMETDKQLGKVGHSGGQMQSELVLDGSKESDYQKSFTLLMDMIDRTLDDYKGDLQQILFPVFAILYLTMIRRGFEQEAQAFFQKFAHLFQTQNSLFNEYLNLLESVKSLQDMKITPKRADTASQGKFLAP